MSKYLVHNLSGAVHRYNMCETWRTPAVTIKIYCANLRVTQIMSNLDTRLYLQSCELLTFWYMKGTFATRLAFLKKKVKFMR